VIIRNIVPGNGKGRWSASLIQKDAFEFHDARAPAEQIGWADLIHWIKRVPLKTPVAIITDHGLGFLAAINSRKQPYLGTEILPLGCEFLNASSDSIAGSVSCPEDTLRMTESGAPSPAVGFAYVIKNQGRELRYHICTCTFDLTKLTGLLPMVQCQMPGSRCALSLRL
jgi:hypothetical protein